jgi:hypothetical protein
MAIVMRDRAGVLTPPVAHREALQNKNPGAEHRGFQIPEYPQRPD